MNYNYLSVCFFLDHLLLSLKVFVADFEHVFVGWKTIAVQSLKYLARQKSTYWKSAVETLKDDVKSAKS